MLKKNFRLGERIRDFGQAVGPGADPFLGRWGAADNTKPTHTH